MSERRANSSLESPVRVPFRRHSHQEHVHDPMSVRFGHKASVRNAMEDTYTAEYRNSRLDKNHRSNLICRPLIIDCRKSNTYIF